MACVGVDDAVEGAEEERRGIDEEKEAFEGRREEGGAAGCHGCYCFGQR